MNGIKSRIVVVLLIAALTGCSDVPDPMMKNVSEQLLVTYSPVRRLTYRNACGENGPIRICVERITTSDAAVLLELRINNRLTTTYQSLNASEPEILLASGNGAFLTGKLPLLQPIPASGEMNLYCRLDGQLSGELKMLVVDNVAAGSLAQKNHNFKIAIDLGG